MSLMTPQVFKLKFETPGTPCCGPCDFGLKHLGGGVWLNKLAPSGHENALLYCYKYEELEEPFISPCLRKPRVGGEFYGDWIDVTSSSYWTSETMDYVPGAGWVQHFDPDDFYRYACLDPATDWWDSKWVYGMRLNVVPTPGHGGVNCRGYAWFAFGDVGPGQDVDCTDPRYYVPPPNSHPCVGLGNFPELFRAGYTGVTYRPYGITEAKRSPPPVNTCPVFYPEMRLTRLLVDSAGWDCRVTIRSIEINCCERTTE